MLEAIRPLNRLALSTVVAFSIVGAAAPSYADTSASAESGIVQADDENSNASAARDVAASSSEDADESTDLGAIVVTGLKINQLASETAASVSVVTEQEIRREPVDDLYQIIERVPNVSSSFGEQGFSIRGIDQRGIGGGGRGNTITVYVDDAPLGNFTTFFGPTGAWDLGQVEVFRGPQSTNFGRNALAGAIYVRTKDPEYRPSFRGRIEYADYDTRQFSFAGGGGLFNDVLAVRVAGNFRESDGFVDNVFLNEPADDTELKTGRIKLLFEPTDALRFLSTTSYTENFAGEDGLVASTAFDREVAYDVDGREGTETFLQSLNATWEISDRMELQSITTFQDTDYVRVEDQDRSPAPLARLDRTGQDRAFTEELRLKYFGDRISGVAGFYFVETSQGFDDTLTIPLAAVVPQLPVSNILQRDLLTDNDATNYAIFADAEMPMTETIDLLFGFRYDREEQDSEFRQFIDVLGDVPPQLAPVIAPIEGETVQITDADFEAFLPKLGLQWKPATDLTLAFVAQRAYRAGGSEVNLADGSINEYDPEFLWNYELSSRKMFLDGALQWNVNAFYSDWTDQQVPVPVSEDISTLFVTVNAGESTVYGLESDLRWLVSSALEIYASIGLVHTEFDDFPNANAGPGEPDNFAGNEFFFAPQLSFNAGFDYQHAGGFFAGVDINHQADAFSDQANLAVNEIGDSTLVNVRAGYQFDNRYRLTLYARNALDEEYFTFLDRDANNDFARVGEPRVIGARFDVEF
jgi:outer membrane receptor protein involved in Fe transport